MQKQVIIGIVNKFYFNKAMQTTIKFYKLIQKFYTEMKNL